MIDDATFALSIVGFKKIDENSVELLFADPHINCNR